MPLINIYLSFRFMNVKKKVLIVEDNVDLQEIYKIYFEAAGFEVIQRTDGLSGIAELVDLKPDLVLLDIMMPQMNGFEVLEVIKNQSSIDIPIIICSNLSQKSDVDKAFQSGADEYFRKSDFDGQQIVEKVIDFMKKKGILPQA